MRWFLIPFVVIPFVELYLLLLISRSLGFWPTMALTFGTGIVGGTFAKREMRRVWRGWTQLRVDGTPEMGVLDSALVLVGGVLLLSPGILTDVVGLALLLRPLRARVATLLSHTLLRKLTTSFNVDATTTTGGPSHTRPGRHQEEVIDTSGEPMP